jgi:hypothetical protein
VGGTWGIGGEAGPLSLVLGAPGVAEAANQRIVIGLVSR